MRSAPRPATRLSRRAVAIAVSVLLIALSAVAPAQASTGGSAEATGMRANAPEVRLTVSTSGAVSMIQPILDRLTRNPLLVGRQQIAAEVTTPEAPSGLEEASTPQRTIPHLLNVAEVSAGTERVQDADLSASASTGAVDVGVLGLDVLAVGPVQATSRTHPTEDPSASADVPSLEVFGQDVNLPADDPLRIEEELSTADALAALEQAFPGISTLTETIGAAVEARGAVAVLLGRLQEADPGTGAAHATALSAQVGLELDVRICIPRIGGSGCLAEVEIGTDAQVLDLVLAETSVERPETLPLVERIPWAVLIPFAVIAGVGLLVFGLLMGKRLTERGPNQGPPGGPGGPAGPGGPGQSGHGPPAGPR